MKECDPMMGDRIERHGNVVESEKEKIDRILQSFRFMVDETQVGLSDEIQIDQPKPNKKISSPLTVKGKARGRWFFEASFPIRLEDKEGNIVARSSSKAQGEWMTEDFVPFESSITFTNPPKGEKGYLVVERANPSGLPKHEESLRVPVYFEDIKKSKG